MAVQRYTGRGRFQRIDLFARRNRQGHSTGAQRLARIPAAQRARRHIGRSHRSHVAQESASRNTTAHRQEVTALGVKDRIRSVELNRRAEILKRSSEMKSGLPNHRRRGIVSGIVAGSAGSIGGRTALAGKQPTSTRTATQEARSCAIAGALSELKALPKVHYSWPSDWTRLPEAITSEFIRITGGITLPGDPYVKQGKRLNAEIVNAAIRAVARLGKSEGTTTRVCLAINYSPWHQSYPPTQSPLNDSQLEGREAKEMERAFAELATEIREAADRFKVDLTVDAALFDSERFHVKPDDPKWNRAITRKYDIAFDLVRRQFPLCKVCWYSRGGVAPGTSNSGWADSPYFTLDERGDGYSCSLYRVPEIEITRETMRRTVARANERGIDRVTPWVALASGYRRQPDGSDKWDFDWNYDQIYSWLLGREINIPWFGTAERERRFAPWRSSDTVVFYPEPMGRSPSWPEHFIAYARGANDDQRLPVKLPAPS